MTEQNESQVGPAAGRDVERRALIRGVAVGGLALPLLAACGSDGGGTGSAAPSGSQSGSGDGGAAGGGTTVAASDVPVGEGKILSAEKVVVTQPSKGSFKAFSAVCTHQGCIVQTVTDGRITCPCHGSAFSVKDGSVINGPATQPLESLSVSVKGDQITVS
ncbi:MAG TPA: Rieske (2Fe-2S) protein [Nocardioidaceae bacterium]|nr:Rieske (2Fe-2S) protein [Nocardioidaceae bacterium]